MASEPINLLLSRDELLYVLDAIKAKFILGLDSDPAGDRSPEQQALAMTVAGRALRARGLAQVLPSGQLAIHNALLAAIGVCAYPQQTVSVYHWPAQQEYTTRYFAHLRGSEVVTHTRPEDVLHLLSRLPSKEYLVDQVLSVCQVNDSVASAPFSFTVPGESFREARQLASTGGGEQAIAALAQQGVAPNGAAALVTTLSHSPHVSIVQALKRGTAGVDKRECTIVQNSTHAWLVQPNGEGNAPLTVSASSKGTIQELLAGWLS